ncbi:MAG: hypothetical protein WC464_06120 [Bdellovibrionales bacterium]
MYFSYAKKLSFLFAALLVLIPLSLPAYAALTGTTCSTLGQSKKEADGVNLIACLKTSASNAALIWKTTTTTVSASPSALEGNTCADSGQTRMDTNKANLIACLKTSASNAALVWKRMTATVSASPTALAGNVCTSLGTTRLDTDKSNLVACLQTSASNASLVWKPMMVPLLTCTKFVSSTRAITIPANLSGPIGYTITGGTGMGGTNSPGVTGGSFSPAPGSTINVFVADTACGGYCGGGSYGSYGTATPFPNCGLCFSYGGKGAGSSAIAYNGSIVAYASGSAGYNGSWCGYAYGGGGGTTTGGKAGSYSTSSCFDGSRTWPFWGAGSTNGLPGNCTSPTSTTNGTVATCTRTSCGFGACLYCDNTNACTAGSVVLSYSAMSCDM